MLGKIVLPNGQTATLEDNGKWQSADEMLAGHLNLNYDPRRVSGVGVVLPFGYAVIYAAARKLGAKIESAPKLPELPPDAES